MPIVPAAILFDLLSGGDKDWGRYPPYRELGYAAAAAASGRFRARQRRRRHRRHDGQLQRRHRFGSARTPDGHIVGALAAVNAVGSVDVGRGPWFWAAPFEQDGEFGGLRLAGEPSRPRRSSLITKGGPRESTTLVVVATDAILTKAQAKRLAVMAHRASRGRSIRSIRRSTATLCLPPRPDAGRSLDPLLGMTVLGTIAANVVARAIARGVLCRRHVAVRRRHAELE